MDFSFDVFDKISFPKQMQQYQDSITLELWLCSITGMGERHKLLTNFNTSSPSYKRSLKEKETNGSATNSNLPLICDSGTF